MADNSVLESIFGLLHEQELTSSKSANQELCKIISLLMRDFIASWFSNLTQDQELYLELIKVISYLIQEFERRCCRVDWVTLLTQDLPSILTNHLRDHRTCCKKMGTAYAGGRGFEEIFYGLQSHVALKSEEAEKEYMRRVSDLLMDALLPETEIQSDAIKLLVCEILCNSVLLNMVDSLSDPDHLNELLLRVLDPSVGESFSESQQDIKYDYRSDASEISVEPADRNLGYLNHKKDMEGTLFQISKNKKKSGFLRRGQGKPTSEQFGNVLNKFTFGGLSSGFDKFKGFVSNNTESIPRPRRRKKKQPSLQEDGDLDKVDTTELEYDINDIGKSPIDKVVPALQVYDSDQGIELNMNAEEANERDDQDMSSPFQNDSTDSPQRETSMEGNINPVSQTPRDVELYNFDFSWVQHVASILWQLHRETVKGPWKLGPINTSQYERMRLEEPLLDLFSEVFEFPYRRNWVLHYFLKPVIISIGGHVINRALIRGTYFVIEEKSIVNYLEQFRLSYWPNNQPALPFIVRSESEKAKIKELLELAIIRIASAGLNVIMKEQTIQERAQYLVDVFQRKQINKHLMYICLDLVLAHLIPESANLKSI